MSFNDGFNIRAVPWPSNTPVSGNSLVYNGSEWLAAIVTGKHESIGYQEVPHHELSITNAERLFTPRPVGAAFVAVRFYMWIHCFCGSHQNIVFLVVG